MSNTATRINTFRTTLSGKPIVLYVSDCAHCGIVFGITTELEQRRRGDKGSFYCPNGHSMIFSTSTADKLRAELDRERDAVARTRADLAHERTQHAATKGKLTKTIKRAAASARAPSRTCSATSTANTRRRPQPTVPRETRNRVLIYLLTY